MSNEKDAKLKALELTLDKLDKAYGKGTVQQMGDNIVENVAVLSSGSLGLDVGLGDTQMHSGNQSSNAHAPAMERQPRRCACMWLQYDPRRRQTRDRPPRHEGPCSRRPRR